MDLEQVQWTQEPSIDESEAQEQPPVSPSTKSSTPNPAPVTPQNDNPCKAIPRAPTPVASDEHPGCTGNADGSGAPEDADPGCLDDEWLPENDDGGAYEQALKAIFEATQLDDL